MPSLNDFLTAYEEYDGDDLSTLLVEWSDKLGVSAY